MLNAALFGAIAAGQSSAQPPDLPLPEEERLPTPLNTKSATTATFNSIVGGAQPGDRINLANGNYGLKTISVSGTQANPIVVRSTTLHQAVFSRITITGNWVIVSGVDMNGGSLTAQALSINGSNVRLTRSLIRNGGRIINIGAGAHDILIDHCNINNFADRMILLADPKDQKRITFARCWVHTMVNGGSLDTCHAFAWAEENLFREKHEDTVMRLNYIGPGEATVGNSDFVHHKGSRIDLRL